MGNTWFCSDHHMGHANILNFKRGDGTPLRAFKNITEHDEYIISKHNELVKPEDRVYFMGDCVIHRRDMHVLSRFNGRKKLIKGNHDIFKLKDYTKYFEDIISYRIYPKQGLIVSHIPIYSGQMGEKTRWNWNVHGHLHSNFVMKNKNELDKRYINLCMEHTEYKPVSFDQILDRIGYDKKEAQLRKENLLW